MNHLTYLEKVNKSKAFQNGGQINTLSKALRFTKKIVAPLFKNNLHEKILILFLNGNLEPLKLIHHTNGKKSSSNLGMRSLFAEGMKYEFGECKHFFIFHNHPSGNANPSGADIKTYLELCEVSQQLSFRCCDSIIITPDGRIISINKIVEKYIEEKKREEREKKQNEKTT